jgi:hypothetical protein
MINKSIINDQLMTTVVKLNSESSVKSGEVKVIQGNIALLAVSLHFYEP